MSDKSVLEQVLEHLLAEDDAQAKDLLHSFMVEKSREIYEDLLDKDALEEAIDNEVVEEESEEEVSEAEESEEEAVEEAEESEEEAVEETVAGSPSEDFYDEVEADVIADESGVNEEEDEMEMEPEFDGEESEDEGEEEVEDRVDDLEAQLDELKAEFEKLMSDEDGDDAEEVDMEPEMDMDGEMDMEDEMESVEYDIEESFEGEVVEEATKLSDSVAEPKGGEADSNESPFSKAPKQSKVEGAGAPVKAKDGGDGNKGESAKDHTPSDNIKVEPKKV